MNPLQAYELTIKGKLEAIPLPDMEDAIWARIKSQLDTDMPTDDGNDHGPAGGIPPRTWIGGGALLIFLVSLLAIFYNRNDRTVNNASQPANTIERSEDSILSNDQSPEIRNDNDVRSLTPQRGGVAVVDSGQAVPEQILEQQLPGLNLPDSAGGNAISLPDPSLNGPLVNSPPSVKDTLPPKKSRGVKNITDNDYKIVPKKDNE